MTDEIAQRDRKLDGTTLRTISDISKHQRLREQSRICRALDILSESGADDQDLTPMLHSTHEL